MRQERCLQVSSVTVFSMAAGMLPMASISGQQALNGNGHLKQSVYVQEGRSEPEPIAYHRTGSISVFSDGLVLLTIDRDTGDDADRKELPSDPDLHVLLLDAKGFSLAEKDSGWFLDFGGEALARRGLSLADVSVLPLDDTPKPDSGEHGDLFVNIAGDLVLDLEPASGTARVQVQNLQEPAGFELEFVIGCCAESDSNIVLPIPGFSSCSVWCPLHGGCAVFCPFGKTAHCECDPDTDEPHCWCSGSGSGGFHIESPASGQLNQETRQSIDQPEEASQG